jgi:pilus assembly protein CpaE
MTSTDRSIVLISEDPVFTERIGALLRATPGRSVAQCNATLASMNGKASDFARQSELIIFQAQPDDSGDIQALHDISKAGGTARFLAISDSKASLAMAHTLMRAGVAEVVPDTLGDDEIDSIVARLSMPRRLSLAPVAPREGQVIAVAKARGGIGATTLAVNLADAMTRRPRRFGRVTETGQHVALVDLDLQFGAVAGFLDLPPNDAFYRVAREHFDPDAVFLDQSVVTLPGGLAVLTAPDGFMPVTSVTIEQIRALIQRLRQKYDFVVIDLPQVMVDWLTPVLEAASRVFVVTGLSVPFIQQSRRLIDFYKDQNPALEVEIVIGKEKKPLLGSRRQAEAEKALGQKFRYWLPRDERVAGDAMDQGRPLSQSAPGSALGKSIAGMAAEILLAAETPAAEAGRNTRK